MELTRDVISSIRLTCVHGQYYLAEEVDACLDELAEAVDKAQQENAKMLEKAQAYERMAYDASTILLLAEQQARDIVKRSDVEREAILSDALKKRERVEAANRASYYHAMQFKQSISQEFKELQLQLESAMSALITADGTDSRFLSEDNGENAPY